MQIMTAMKKRDRKIDQRQWKYGQTQKGSSKLCRLSLIAHTHCF